MIETPNTVPTNCELMEEVWRLPRRRPQALLDQVSLHLMDECTTNKHKMLSETVTETVATLSIRWSDLNRLAMLTKDVHSHDCIVEFRIGRLDQFIVQVFLQSPHIITMPTQTLTGIIPDTPTHQNL